MPVEQERAITKKGLLQVGFIAAVLIFLVFFMFYKIGGLSSDFVLQAVVIIIVGGISLAILLGFVIGKKNHSAFPEMPSAPEVKINSTIYAIKGLVYFAGVGLLGAYLLKEGAAQKDKYEIAGGITALTVSILVLALMIVYRKSKK
jgi:hypothetical protein